MHDFFGKNVIIYTGRDDYENTTKHLLISNLDIERILLYIKYKRMFDAGGTYSWKTKNTLHLLLNYLKETGTAQKRSIISLSDSWKDDLQFYLQITSEGVALVATLLFSQIS